MSHISYNEETWHSYTLLKEDPKNIWIAWHTLVTTADISILSLEISKFSYIKKYRYRLHFSKWFLILFLFLESLKFFLINLVIILMMLVKMAAPGLLKIPVFWNKGYDNIISVGEVTNKVLSHDSIYIGDMVTCPKFGNLHFYERSNSNLNFIRTWPEKPVFWGVVLVQVQ